jgi:tetratricopeptide (TPR) repeat protein
MTTLRLAHLAPTFFLTTFATACLSAKHVDEGPITVMRNGERVAGPVRATDAATTRALEARLEGRDRRDSLAATAFATCAPPICAALGRGELALGMSEAQVLAATRSTTLAWTARRSGEVTVMAPRDEDAGPRDAVAPVVLVQLAEGGVAGITYREPQGLRTVTAPADVSDANRVRALALSREGDAMAAAGDFTAALERYDRASVVDRADAELQYKIATALDKLLRPREAALRYQLFLHRLELEKIEATGSANAKLAAAIVQARERIVVLERR